MALRDFERALLTLYTDADFLRRFLAEGEIALAGFSLSEREQKALTGIPRDALSTFQRQLSSKSMGVARHILKMPNRVVLIPFHAHGPRLMWKTSSGFPNHPLSRGAYEIVHSVYRTKEPLTVRALLRQRKETHHTSFGDMVSVAKVIYSNGLAGSEIRVPLVL